MKQKTQADYEATASKMDSPFNQPFGEDYIFNNAPKPEYQAGADKENKPNRVILTCGADMTPEPILWLWKEWIAQGKFHILAGQPGVGKTTISLALAATVTIGGRWPDGERCEAGNIIIWSGEDDPADTLLPRLIASGADRNKVYFVNGTESGDTVRPFDPSTDLSMLEKVAHDIGGVKLIIVDPVVNAVSGDSHKNTETRRDLQPIVEMATRLNAAVIGITHLSKGGAGQDPVSRVIGSIAFTALPRVVMVAAKITDADGKSKRLFMRGKSNCGPDDGGFEYYLEQSEPLPGIHASSASWGSAVAGTARELLAETTANSEEVSHKNDAASMLEEELSDSDWTDSKVASKPLIEAGFSKKKIWSASQKLNVIRKKDGMNGAWLWRLQTNNGKNTPEDSILPVEDSEDSLLYKRGIFGTFGSKMESSTVVF